jgi:hypothetical protein
MQINEILKTAETRNLSIVIRQPEVLATEKRIACGTCIRTFEHQRSIWFTHVWVKAESASLKN